MPASGDARHDKNGSDEESNETGAATERSESDYRYGRKCESEYYAKFMVELGISWKSFQENGPKWIEAACAVLLVLITGYYAYHARRQADSSEIAAQAAKAAADTATSTLKEMQGGQGAKDTHLLALTSNDALVSVQRAFVSPREIIETNIIDPSSHQFVGYEANFGWQNDGVTPAVKLTEHTSMAIDQTQMPSNFKFGDAWYKGQPRNTPVTYIAPRGSIGANNFVLPITALKGVQAGTLFVYFWGWANYQDVFRRKHLTRFCMQLKSNDPSALFPSKTFPFRYDACPAYTCMDEECKAK